MPIYERLEEQAELDRLHLPEKLFVAGIDRFDVDRLAGIDHGQRTPAIVGKQPRLECRSRRQRRDRARKLRENRMFANAPEPVGGIAEVGFTTMHEAVQVAAVRVPQILADRVGGIQIIVP